MVSKSAFHVAKLEVIHEVSLLEGHSSSFADALYKGLL